MGASPAALLTTSRGCSPILPACPYPSTSAGGKCPWLPSICKAAARTGATTSPSRPLPLLTARLRNTSSRVVCGRSSPARARAGPFRSLKGASLLSGSRPPATSSPKVRTSRFTLSLTRKTRHTRYGYRSEKAGRKIIVLPPGPKNPGGRSKIVRPEVLSAYFFENGFDRLFIAIVP